MRHPLAVLVLSVFFASLPAVSRAQEQLLLADFEGKLDPGWSKNGKDSAVAFVKEHATRGEQALKLTIKGEYPGIALVLVKPADWTRFDTLKMDLFNASDEVLTLEINVRDADSGGEYTNRAALNFPLKPGATAFVFALPGLKATGGRVLDRSRIVQMLIMFKPGKAPSDVFFDNLRLTGVQLPAAEGLRAFDFGPVGSPVFPGFTPVNEKTKYTDATGFGWLLAAGFIAVDRGSPGDLERDWIRGDGTFAVKVPKGKYRVWMLMTDSGAPGVFQYWSRRVVKAGGKVVVDQKQTQDEFLKKGFFANLDVEDLPGQDIHMLYVESRWAPVEFDVNVVADKLEIELGGDSGAALVNALVVYPLTGKDAGEAWMKNLAERRKKAFYLEHTEVPPPEKPAEVFPNEQEKKRGYAIFQRPWSEPVWPTSSPKGGGKEIDRLEVSLAKGEFEPITFAVFPFRDLGKVKVTAQVGFPFDRAREVLSVGYVQYKVKRTTPSGSSYRVTPLLIRKAGEVRIDKGITRQFWLTLECPEGFPARDYEGSVTITPELGEPTMLPLAVHVCDFALTEPKDRGFALYGTRPQWFRTWLGGPKDEMWKAFDGNWRNQRVHGLNTVVADSGVEPLRGMMAAVKTDPGADVFRCILPYGNKYRTGVELDAEKLMKSICDEAKRSGWPAPVFCVVDDPSGAGEPARADALKLAQALRKIKGVKLSGNLDSPADAAFFPLLDCVGLSGPLLTSAMFKQVKDAGATPWLIDAGKERFWWGPWFFCVSRDFGAGLKQDYAYQAWQGDPFFDLDGTAGDDCLAYPGPDGDINTPAFEECREGITDFKYLSLVDQLTQQAKTRSAEKWRLLSQEGDKFLNEVSGRVKPDRDANKPWTDEECQDVRTRAAKLIEQMQPKGEK